MKIKYLKINLSTVSIVLYKTSNNRRENAVMRSRPKSYEREIIFVLWNFFLSNIIDHFIYRSIVSMRKYSNGSIVENSLGKARLAVFAHPEGGLLELQRTHLMTSDASKTAVRLAKNATVAFQTSKIHFDLSTSVFEQFTSPKSMNVFAEKFARPDRLLLLGIIGQ